MDTCPTVKIKAANAAGFILVNESDFDPARHERFGVATLPPPPAAPIRERETLKLKGK